MYSIRVLRDMEDSHSTGTGTCNHISTPTLNPTGSEFKNPGAYLASFIGFYYLSRKKTGRPTEGLFDDTYCIPVFLVSDVASVC